MKNERYEPSHNSIIIFIIQSFFNFDTTRNQRNDAYYNMAEFASKQDEANPVF